MRQAAYVNSADSLAVIIVLKKVSDKLAFFYVWYLDFKFKMILGVTIALASNQFRAVFRVFIYKTIVS